MDQRHVLMAHSVRLPLTRHPDLPSDFLSTPFGAALRPTIDAMFRRPTGLTPPAAAGQQPSSTPASSLLQGVADRATARDSGYSTPSSSAVAGAIHVSTNPASFRSLLESHRAVVAMFTSATCGPCRMIEPVFEDIAHAKSRGRAAGNVAFAKVDLAVGMGGAIARQYNVAATPTFGFFLDGKRVCIVFLLGPHDDDDDDAQIHELKGVNAPELRTQVDLLLYQAFPRKSIPGCGRSLILDGFLQLIRTRRWTFRPSRPYPPNQFYSPKCRRLIPYTINSSPLSKARRPCKTLAN